MLCSCFFFFSSRRRHTRCSRDWSSDVCSSDLEPLGRLATVSARPPQSSGDGVAFRTLDGVTEGDLTPSFPLSTLWRGGRGASTNEISRLQDLLVTQHRSPFDGVLERAHVAGPRLFAQPLERRVAQGHAPAEPAGEPGRKMSRQGRAV